MKWLIVSKSLGVFLFGIINIGSKHFPFAEIVTTPVTWSDFVKGVKGKPPFKQRTLNLFLPDSIVSSMFNIKHGWRSITMLLSEKKLKIPSMSHDILRICSIVCGFVTTIPNSLQNSFSHALEGIWASSIWAAKCGQLINWRISFAFLILFCFKLNAILSATCVGTQFKSSLASTI